MKNKMYRFLKVFLLIVSCGFYVLPVHGFECPGHPKSGDEILQEEKEAEKKRRQTDPKRHLGNEEQQQGYLDGEGDLS